MKKRNPSSKNSSKSSSPNSTIREAHSLLSLSDILAESHLDELYHNPEILLRDKTYLDLLCSKSEDYEEFPALLYRFFYVHDKTHYLLRWALERDINSLSPQELFRGETMATRLFYYQFFGDLGRRFVTSLLTPLIEEFATLDRSVEIEPARLTSPLPDGYSADENVKYVVESLTIFVGGLQDAADNCPLDLRESFLFLKDVVGAKVENSNVFIASVLFLRLICPCLVSPEEYNLVSPGTLTVHGRRALVIASKILQSAANNFPWEDKPGCKLVNHFIKHANPYIIEFASNLIDAETIRLGRKVIRASVVPVSQTEMKLCHESLEQFISAHILQNRLKSNIDFEQKYQLAMNMYNSKDWKVCHQAKKPEYHICVSHLKQEGSNLVAFRYTGRFKQKYELVKEYIRDYNPELTLDERVESNTTIERHSNNHWDTYWVTKPQFPVSARDFVYTSKQVEESPDRWIQLTYSIDREDKPIVKSSIRGVINVMFFCIERDLDPEYTQYNYIFHMDLKGWLPVFLINNNSKMCFNSLQKITKRIMALGTPEPQTKELKKKKEKDIKQEKSGN